MNICTLIIMGIFLSLVTNIASKKCLNSIKKVKNGLASIISSLKSNLNAVKLFPTGLSTQLTSRWIKHPQAIPRTGILNNLISIIRLNWLVINCIYTACMNTVLGARIESQRKRSHVAVLCWQCFAATQSTFVNSVSTGKSL